MPQEYHLAILKNRFHIFLKSNLALPFNIDHAKLDLVWNELSFNVHETEQFDWLNWILKIPNGEVMTLFFVDEYGNTQCMINFYGLLLESHEFEFSNLNNESLYHAIKIKFEKAERMVVDKPFQKPQALINNLV